MQTDEYKRMYRAEESHWWYRGMENLTRRLLATWYKPNARLHILDVGCGTGWAISTYLKEYGSPTGIDLASPALTFCRQRKLASLAQANAERLPFAPEQFHLVTSFDVLYEDSIQSDQTALQEIQRVLKPGGRVLLRLPAYNWLRGQHDQVVHTARRYSAAQVRRLLGNAHLQVEFLTYANSLLFPLALAKRGMENLLPRSRQPQSELSIPFLGVNRLLRLLLAAEAPFALRQALPFGLSIVAAARKPNP